MNSSVGTAEMVLVVAPGEQVTPVAAYEHALRGPVAGGLETELANLGVDPAIVVHLRHVHVDVDLDAPAPEGPQVDAGAIRAWTRQLAAGVRRSIDGDRDIRVFPDENGYWAELLADLAGGQPPAWHHRAQAGLWQRSRPDAVTEVLAQVSDPAGVLRSLAAPQTGPLVRLLAELPQPVVASVARRVLGSGSEGDEALVGAAIAVADRLRLWRERPWSLERFREAGLRPMVADWRSTGPLTEVVVDLLAQLLRRGAIRSPAETALIRAELTADGALSWLDLQVLETRLRSLPSSRGLIRSSVGSAAEQRFPVASGRPTHDAGPWVNVLAAGESTDPLPKDVLDEPESAEAEVASPPSSGPDRPARETGGQKRDQGEPARQQDAAGDRSEHLAADIARVVADEHVALLALESADARALLLTTALTTRFSHWQGDQLVGPTVRRAVAVWEPAVAAIREPGAATVRDRGAVFGSLPVQEPEAEPVPNQAPAAATGPEEPNLAVPPLVPGAGVLLLVRAVIDLRLPAVIGHADRDPDAAPAALLAAARQLAGPEAGAAAGRRQPGVDVAMVAFAGLLDQRQEPRRRAELLAPWPSDRCEALAGRLRTVLAGQGLDGAELDLDHGVGGLVGDVVLRAWRRWLGGLARSSTGYLLTQFIRRPGQVAVGTDRVLVTMTSRPLDVVLEQSGYLSPLRGASQLGGRDLVFRTED